MAPGDSFFCFTLIPAAADSTQDQPAATFNHKKLCWGEENTCSEFSSASGTFLYAEVVFLHLHLAFQKMQSS